MKLNIGDKVIWIEEMVDKENTLSKLNTHGKVVNAPFEYEVAIEWENGRIINYSYEQLRNMVTGHYSGTMILDTQSIRQDKLEALGI